jgi:hypothetical protein
MASRLLWSGKLKPMVNPSVAGLYQTTEIYVPVKHPNLSEGYNILKKKMSARATPTPSISQNFIKSTFGKIQQQCGKGPELDEALKHPVKVNAFDILV